MRVMLWTLLVLLVASGIGEATSAGRGGRTKSAGMCAIDSVFNLLLAGWVLWFLAQ